MNTNILTLLEEQINSALGITLPHFNADGKNHYFSDPGHHNPKNTAGHYKIINDGVIGGVAIAYVGSYWTGSLLNDGSTDRQFYQVEDNKNNKGRKINLDDEQIRYLKEKDENRKREKLLKRKSVANLAKEAINGAELILDMSDPSPYLVAKNIQPLGLSKIRNWDNKDVLLAPAQDAKGEIQGYQSIFEDGFKANQTGFAPNGSYFLIGTIDPTTPHKIYLCEGVATGISIYMATEIATCAAFNTGNLQAAARALKSEFPNHDIIGLADHDDRWKKGKVPSHAGYKAMTGAMNAINSYFKLPSFEFLVASEFLDDSEQSLDIKHPTDFNDLFCLAGPEEVRRQITENSQIPLPNNFKKSQPVIPTSKLREHFLEQFDPFFAALEDPSANPSFMLRAPAASGKTSMFMESLSKACESYPGIRGAAYFPTHNLARQETEKARKLGIDAIQIFGRNEPGYCKKNEAITLYHNLGGQGNTFKTFCDDGKGDECEHKSDCLYLNQFKSPRQLSCFTHAHLIQYPNGLEEDLYEGKRPHFIFVDENYTQGCEKNSSCPRAFFNENKNIPPGIKGIILDCLDDNKPLLKALREYEINEFIKEEGEKAVIHMIEKFNGVTFSGALHKDNPCVKKWATHKAVSQIDDLIKEEGEKAVTHAIETFNGGATFSGKLYSENPLVVKWANQKAVARIDAVLKELTSSYPSFDDISPSMKIETAISRLQKKERGINIRAPLRQIKLELEKTTRIGVTGVHLYTKKDGNAIISTHYVQPISRHKRPIPYSQNQLEDNDYVPLIISDAHLNESIVQKSLDLPFTLPLVQVNAEPNLEVIQVSSTELSGKSLALKGDQYMQDVFNIAEAEKPERCLIIGPQKYVGNEKNGIPAHPTIEKLKNLGAQTAHWGGLRGIDRFKDIPCVITFSRLQPPTSVIENQARCWYSDDNVPLNFNTEKLPVQYDMRDETQRWSETFYMSDPRCQDFLSSYREDEIEQGVFRTRPIHGSKKKAYILTSIPTELKIDRLVEIQELRGNRAPQYIIPQLFRRFFDPKNPNAPLVMPMGPGVLYPLVKDLFSSEDVLKNYISRNAADLKKFIADETGTKTEEISYRLGGSKGRSRRAVVLLSDEELIKGALSEMHPNREIVIEGVATDVGIIPSLLKDYWNSTLEVGREVLEKILEVTGVREVNLVFNNIIENLSQDDLNDLSAWDVWETIKKLGPRLEYG